MQDGARRVDDATEFRVRVFVNSLDELREDGRFVPIVRRGGPSILNGRSELFEDRPALSRHVFATERFE